MKHTILSFLFVQLPNYQARADAPVESDWAEVRIDCEGQAESLTSIFRRMSD